MIYGTKLAIWPTRSSILRYPGVFTDRACSQENLVYVSRVIIETLDPYRINKYWIKWRAQMLNAMIRNDKLPKITPRLYLE